jgi:DNA primase
VRQAIALILHHPAAAAAAGIPDQLSGLDFKGIPLLTELLEIAGSNPDISPAGLLERWRDRPEQPHLLQLAASEALVTGEAAPAVLGDILTRLVNQAGPEQRTTLLLEKARESGLDETEKEELRRLLSRGTAQPDSGRGPAT